MNARKIMYLCVLYVMTGFITSCNEIPDSVVLTAENLEETSPEITMEVPSVLKFESNEHFQNVLDKIKEEVELSDLRSEKLLPKLKKGNKSPVLELRALPKPAEFISLFDVVCDGDLAHLTTSDWNIINSDPENLVYEPEDGIISDAYLASLVNADREVQIDDNIFKYTANGIYFVKAENYNLLTQVDVNGATPNNPLISVYVPQSAGSSSSRPTLSGSLKLGNGVTVPAGNIRDLNFKDRGDANMISNFWTGLWGDHTVAIQKFSDNRHMVVNFYQQDYLIYKNIGTKAKMQKKLFGLWWNCDAQEIRLGWEAVELKESYSVFPFKTTPQPSFTQNVYPNLRSDEQKMPLWLSKDFPFENNYTLFTIPFANYDVTTYDINKLYKNAQTVADKSIKAWMKSENKSSAPTGLGFVGLEKETVIRYIVGPNEVGNTKKGSLEKKFLSEWFGGTYSIGYATDPNAINFQVSKFQVTIKGNGTSLGRGSIYGAVKYDGKWLAARILKSE